MGSETTWIVANTTGRAVTAALVVELSPFPGPRRVDVLLDGAAWQSLRVERSRRTYELGPMLIGPDGHAMTFRAAEPAIVADRVLHNGDPRALSVAFGNWRWIVQEDR